MSTGELKSDSRPIPHCPSAHRFILLLYSALESLLTSLANIFESELSLLVSRTDDLVHDLAEDITREELNRLLGLRGAVGEFLGRTVGIRRAIDRLLSEGAYRNLAMFVIV